MELIRAPSEAKVLQRKYTVYGIPVLSLLQFIGLIIFINLSHKSSSLNSEYAF